MRGMIFALIKYNKGIKSIMSNFYFEIRRILVCYLSIHTLIILNLFAFTALADEDINTRKQVPGNELKQQSDESDTETPNGNNSSTLLEEGESGQLLTPEEVRAQIGALEQEFVQIKKLVKDGKITEKEAEERVSILRIRAAKIQRQLGNTTKVTRSSCRTAPLEEDPTIKKLEENVKTILKNLDDAQFSPFPAGRLSKHKSITELLKIAQKSPELLKIILKELLGRIASLEDRKSHYYKRLYKAIHDLISFNENVQRRGLSRRVGFLGEVIDKSEASVDLVSVFMEMMMDEQSKPYVQKTLFLALAESLFFEGIGNKLEQPSKGNPSFTILDSSGRKRLETSSKKRLHRDIVIDALSERFLRDLKKDQSDEYQRRLLGRIDKQHLYDVLYFHKHGTYPLQELDGSSFILNDARDSFRSDISDLSSPVLTVRRWAVRDIRRRVHHPEDYIVDLDDLGRERDKAEDELLKLLERESDNEILKELADFFTHYSGDRHLRNNMPGLVNPDVPKNEVALSTVLNKRGSNALRLYAKALFPESKKPIADTLAFSLKGKRTQVSALEYLSKLHTKEQLRITVEQIRSSSQFNAVEPAYLPIFENDEFNALIDLIYETDLKSRKKQKKELEKNFHRAQVFELR